MLILHEGLYHLSCCKLKSMLGGYTYSVVDRFMRYVQIDTQSDPQSNTHPS